MISAAITELLGRNARFHAIVGASDLIARGAIAADQGRTAEARLPPTRPVVRRSREPDPLDLKNQSLGACAQAAATLPAKPSIASLASPQGSTE